MGSTIPDARLYVHLVVHLDLTRARQVRGEAAAEALIQNLHNSAEELKNQVQADPCLREFVEVRQDLGDRGRMF